MAPHSTRLSTISCTVSIEGSYLGTVKVDARPAPYAQLRINPTINSHPVTLRTFQDTLDSNWDCKISFFIKVINFIYIPHYIIHLLWFYHIIINSLFNGPLLCIGISLEINKLRCRDGMIYNITDTVYLKLNFGLHIFFHMIDLILSIRIIFL